MFQIAISLRFIYIINKSWHLLQTFGWNVKPLFKKYQQWQLSNSFDLLVLLISIHSEPSILSKYSLYNMGPSIKYVRFNKPNIWPHSPLLHILTKEWHHQNDRRTLLVRNSTPLFLHTYFMDGPLCNDSFKNIAHRIYLYTTFFLKIYYSSSDFYTY